MVYQVLQRQCQHRHLDIPQQPQRRLLWRPQSYRNRDSRLSLALEVKGLHTGGVRRRECSAYASSDRQDHGAATETGTAERVVAKEAAGIDAAEAEGRGVSDSGAGLEGRIEEDEPDGPSMWDLPLDALMPEDGVGWGEDIFGPTGPENYDNPYDNKIQYTPNAESIDVIGMGSWRLRGFASPLFQALVANIEGAWRHLIEDLGLFILPKEWKYIDSLDPKGKYGSWSHQDLVPPRKGAKGWPRLQIENRCYHSRVFRKLHMEVAHRQDDLEVFHCVMYPRLEFDLPILSMDVVAKGGKVSLAIIDPCPVSLDRLLPSIYNEMMPTLQEGYRVQNNRSIPEWGQEIFSQHCVMMRPESEEELAKFVEYAVGLTRVHLRYAHNIQPVKTDRVPRMHAMKAAHVRYGEQQLRNSKTRRVLEAAFSSEFAETYMRDLMFDTAPKPAKTEHADEAASQDDGPADKAQHSPGEVP